MNNDKLIKEITKKRKELEEAKDEKSKIEGRLEEHYNQLDKEFDCESIKEAEIKLKKFDREIKEKQTSIESGIEEWREKYSEET